MSTQNAQLQVEKCVQTEFDIGEVRCFGRNVFMGYLNRETETKEVMAADEGWLNLGHLGYRDPDDYLVVHGRRENFVTLRSGGGAG